jgi:hypothetical protein
MARWGIILLLMVGATVLVGVRASYCLWMTAYPSGYVAEWRTHFYWTLLFFIILLMVDFLILFKKLIPAWRALGN